MAMKKKDNGIRWAFMHRSDIPDIHDPSKTYLTRFRLIETPAFGIFLHVIRINDSDRHIHSHPWSFWSIILRGGYEEVGPHRLDVDSIWKDGNDQSVQAARRAIRNNLARPTLLSSSPIWLNTHVRRFGSFHRVEASDFHSVLRLLRSPTWTLVFVGRHDPAGWGFATPDGFVHNRDYLSYMAVPGVGVDDLLEEVHG